MLFDTQEKVWETKCPKCHSKNLQPKQEIVNKSIFFCLDCGCMFDDIEEWDKNRRR